MASTKVGAQSFSSTYDTSRASFAGTGVEIKCDNKIRSTSSTPVYLKWNLVEKVTPTGWSLEGFCDNVTCYLPGGLAIGQPHVSAAYGSTDGVFYALFKADAAPDGSQAYIRVRARDTVTGYEKLFVYIATKGAAGISVTRYEEDDVVLYPNPAREFLNVKYSPAAGVKTIGLYNLIGKPVVIYRTQSPASAELRLDGVPAGVYFIRLQDAQGRVVATRRFTHQ